MNVGSNTKHLHYLNNLDYKVYTVEEKQLNYYRRICS